VESADVVIVGAGVIGAAIAYTLSGSTRLRIVVLERGTPGCESSNAAAGVLAVASGQARRGVLLELRRISAALFPGLVAALEDETGIGLEYRRDGLLSLAFSELQAHDLRDLVRHRTEQGLQCELLDRATVVADEPAVNPHVCAAAWFGDDGSVNSGRLVAALVSAARQRGVEFRMHAAVQSVSSTSAGATVRWVGGCLEAAVVVVAAGAWSGELLAGGGIKVPLRPARGEMVAIRPTAWRLRRTLSGEGTYLVPRRSGDVLIGSTTAFVGFDRRVTADGVATLLARAGQLVPGARDVPVLNAWAGLRPCATIRRPIIAPLPRMEKVVLATGHHRNGILLAPITARLVTEMITGSQPTVSLRPFGFRRH
jgi:glycine oxidase